LFAVNFAVVFIFNVFPFPPSKAQSLGDVPVNRKNAANYSPLIGFLCNGGWREIEMHLAPELRRSEFAASINFKFYFADFFSFHGASPSNAGWLGASIGNARCKREREKKTSIATVL
jgi:hypothetical protein